MIGMRMDRLRAVLRYVQCVTRSPRRFEQGYRPKGRHLPDEEGRSQRAVPMRLRQEIQEMLRAQLIAIAALTGGLLCLERNHRRNRAAV